jgi:hypothetical protein
VSTAPQLHQVEEPDLLDKHYEPCDVAITRHLGLRSPVFDKDGPHPDERPCPSWCWVGQSNGEYHHTIDLTRIAHADHSMEGVAHVAVTGYPGHGYRSEDAAYAATVEVNLEQLGQGSPVLRLALRYGEDEDRRMAYDELVKLKVNEARELIAVLGYFIEIAESS